MELTKDRLTPEGMKAEEQKGFAEFMAKPETKLTISLIPTGPHQEAVETLARSAYAAGSGQGQGLILVEMMKSMFANKDR